MLGGPPEVRFFEKDGNLKLEVFLYHHWHVTWWKMTQDVSFYEKRARAGLRGPEWAFSCNFCLFGDKNQVFVNKLRYSMLFNDKMLQP